MMANKKTVPLFSSYRLYLSVDTNYDYIGADVSCKCTAATWAPR
jgi:hypothetical protein